MPQTSCLHQGKSLCSLVAYMKHECNHKQVNGGAPLLLYIFFFFNLHLDPLLVGQELPKYHGKIFKFHVGNSRAWPWETFAYEHRHYEVFTIMWISHHDRDYHGSNTN